MASPNLDELVTTTLRNRSGALSDNVSANNALLFRLKERGKIKPYDGGRTITQELEYAENSAVSRYSGYELLNTTPSDVFTAADFDYKQIAVAVMISGLEQLQNSGKEKIIDLLDARIGNAERTLNNTVSGDIYSNGTAAGGKQIGGLQLLVADSPTSGTVGGINRANWSFWRNQKFQCTSDGGSAASAANIQRFMNTLYNSLVRGNDKPDLIPMDANYYGFYESSLQTIQRVSTSKMADAGFEALKFKGADVVLDGGVDGSCPTNHAYFLNTNYIRLRPHKDRNFVPFGGNRSSANQDAMVKFIGFAGNMTLSNGRLQGVMFQD